MLSGFISLFNFRIVFINYHILFEGICFITIRRLGGAYIILGLSQGKFRLSSFGEKWDESKFRLGISINE